MNRKPSSKSMRPASPSSLTDVLRQGPNGNRYTATRDSSRAPSEGVGGHGELPWGPQHPCFPHPNPHVPVASPLYSSTRIIRVKRDWLASGDLYPAYQNVYPEVLSDCLSEAEFRNVVETLNARLKAAYTPWSAGSWIDGVLSVATGGVWDDVGLTVGKRKADGVEKWIEEWNREMEKSGREVRLIGLKRTGYLSLDIQILDPGVDAEG
ncbi:hypothetical protein H2203_002446 [Taxawa tesnikishii (nom. ined.)]|nr:hypothetical protein H2203_002446 [Dothideales sp. JES 119]